MAEQKILEPADNQANADLPVGTPLRDLTDDGADWDQRKARSVSLATALLDLSEANTTAARRYQRQLDCSAHIELGRVLDDKNKQRWVTVRARRCKSKLCPTCQRLKATADFCRLIQAINDNATGDRRFVFLTLTVPNCQIKDLRATCQAMSEAWYKRIARLKWFKSAFEGSYTKLEVTRGDDGSAHPHFHVLLATTDDYFRRDRGPTYLTQADWTERWTSAMKSNQQLIVDIRAVRSVKLGKSLIEMTKYISKPDDLEADPAWTLEYDSQVKGIRATRPGGVIREWLDELESKKHQTDFVVPFAWMMKEAIYCSTGSGEQVEIAVDKHEKWTRGER